LTRRNQKGRPVNGILLLNKPAGITSNGALQRVKYLMYAAKAGHTGSLDPLATGVLPICLGEATKFTQFLLDSDKAYASTLRLGVTTATGDADGEVLMEQSTAGITAATVESAMAKFRGQILQVPSMYSALKKDGTPLYKLARQGIEVERMARPATIHSFCLLDFRPGKIAEVDVEVRCSKGTYIRTLAEDLGCELGCGAHVASLHRLAAGPFRDDQTITLAQLETLREGKRAEELDFLLQPVETSVADLARVKLPDSVAWYFRRGQPVMVPGTCRNAEQGDKVRIFDTDGQFLGVGEVMEDGRVTPRRLVVE